MAKTFRPYEPDQLLLLPPSLDLTAIEDTYNEERGYPPYHPRG